MIVSEKLDDTKCSMKRSDKKHGLTLTNEHKQRLQLPTEDTQLTFGSNKENTSMKLSTVPH